MPSPSTRSRKTKRTPLKEIAPVTSLPETIQSPSPIQTSSAIQSLSPIPPEVPIVSKMENSAEVEDHLKSLIRQRKAVQGKLERVCAALSEDSEKPNAKFENMFFLQLQSRALDNIYSECNEIQNKVIQLPLSEDDDRVQAEEYNAFEETFNEASVRLSMLMHTVPKVEAITPAIQQPPQPYLPPLQVPLPEFDGSYEKWYTFKARFTSVMKRYPQEDDALKLYHLQKCLVGKAAGIIDDELVNNNSYETAWKVLTHRFEDKRIVVDKHIDNIFNVQKIDHENATSLRNLIDTCIKNVEALTNHSLSVNGLGEQMLVILITGKFDRKMRVAWEAKQKRNELPTYTAMVDFLEEQWRIADRMETSSKQVNKEATGGYVLVASESKNEPKCPVCKAAHQLWKCETYRIKPVSERYEIAKKCGACFNCLTIGHRSSACSSGSCRHCGKRHHTSFHQERQAASSASEITPANHHAHPGRLEKDSTPTERPSILCASAVNLEKQTVLSTAVVLVDGKGRHPHKCRALLDSGSQLNFITEEFANLLSLKSIPADVTVSGLNGKKTRITRLIRTMLRSCDGDFAAELDLLVTPQIMSDLPRKSFDILKWPIPTELTLADPTFNKKGPVDILIGGELFWSMLQDGRYEIGANLPMLKQSKLGWIAGGVIASDATIAARTFCQTTKSSDKVGTCHETHQSRKEGDEMSLRMQHTEQLNQTLRQKELELEKVRVESNQQLAELEQVRTGLQISLDRLGAEHVKQSLEVAQLREKVALLEQIQKFDVEKKLMQQEITDLKGMSGKLLHMLEKCMVKLDAAAGVGLAPDPQVSELEESLREAKQKHAAQKCTEDAIQAKLDILEWACEKLTDEREQQNELTGELEEVDSSR